MKAPYSVATFGENQGAGFNAAQKALQEKYGTHPASVEVLAHPHRFGPQKFADRLLAAMIAGKKPRGISPRHADIVEKAKTAINEGKAAAFPLHGGNAKMVRESSSAKRLQGGAYLFFGLVDVEGDVAKEVSAPAEPAVALKSDGSDPAWTEPATGEPEDWAKLEA